MPCPAPLDRPWPIPSTAKPGSSTARIEPKNSNAYNLEWPGGVDTPGNRDLPDQPQVANDSHFDVVGGPDESDSITTFYYDFPTYYDGLENEITAAQLLVQDVLQVYANYLGVKFVQTYATNLIPTQLNIVVGDLKAVGGESSVGTPGGYAFLTLPPEPAEGIAEMDGGADWGDNAYGGPFFNTAMLEIGNMLGYGYDDGTSQLSDFNTATTAPEPTASNVDTTAGTTDTTTNLVALENILPSGLDIATGQYMYRTDGNNVDLYQFQLPTSGTVDLEALAQQLQTPDTETDMLNTYLELYNSSGQVIARNDDYFGTDSYISMANLPVGTYYVGVSASGDDNYNPAVPFSGMGGTSQGPYELRISFSPSPAAGYGASRREHFAGQLGKRVDVAGHRAQRQQHRLGQRQRRRAGHRAERQQHHPGQRNQPPRDPPRC